MATIQKKPCRGRAYWQIVESRRINGKPRPVVLLHLGTAEGLLRRLQQGSGKPLKARVLQFGAIAALWNLAEELKVVSLIDQQVAKREQGLSCGQYLLLATLNRCVAPSSKAALYDWYRQTVLPRLLPAPQHALSSQRFWDHMGYLDAEKIATIEASLAAELIEHFGIDLRTLIFDATNFDTFMDTQTDSTLAQRGHAKSKRADLRIVGLALLVSTDFAVPLLSHLYAGNQNDCTTFASVSDTLVQRFRQFARQCEHITLVFDGGNTSDANMRELDAGPYHFITSLTLTSHSDLLHIPLSRFQSFSPSRLHGVRAHRTTKEIWGQTRTVVITRSETLLRGQLAGLAVSLRKKRAALRTLRAKLRRSQQPAARGKGYSQSSLQTRLSEITSGQYISDILKTELFTDPDGRLDFRFWTDPSAFETLKHTRLGKRILCTDNSQWSTEEIILGSRAQFHVENAFRQMKNPHWVSFSPTFHWTDQKLRVHAFYCVLALTLAHLLQRKAAQAGMDLSVGALFEQLSDITEIITLHAPAGPSSPGRLRAEYVLSELSPLQAKLATLFDIHRLTHR
jgi:transposase